MFSGLVRNWWVVGWLVQGVNKTQEKNMFAVVIMLLHFGRELFCYSNFIYLYINNKKEARLTATIIHSNF